MKQTNFDLIVIGAGAAGMTAAVAAATTGASVLLVEHTERIGGTTAISGGMVWIPNNHKMPASGHTDTTAAVWRYLEQTVPGARADARMHAYIELGDAAIRFLEEHSEVKLRPVARYPDYYASLEGATAGGRVLEPLPFDARTLGRDFRRLRDPLPEFMLLGGMMVGREDIPKLRKIGKSAAATWHCAKLVARYARQRLDEHRGTSLVLGNALAARLFKSVLQLGVHIRTGVQVQKLLIESGEVRGVVASVGGTRQIWRANNAVILATGGISHHPILRPSYVPPSAGNLSATVNSGAETCGATLSASSGATLSARSSGIDEALAFWVPVSTWKRPDGRLAVFPHTVTDRGKPGLIAVDQKGERFTNEAVSYHEFVRAQLRHGQAALPAWLICDRSFLWKYGLGKVRPFALSTRQEVACGYLHKAPSVAALAISIGVPPSALEATVESFNAAARRGEDPEFGRGSDIYQKHMGDSDHQPNPCVAPIEAGPFYAVQVAPADLGMAAGIRTDAQARALRDDNTPITGLYACGNDMESIMRGAYPGPGITLGPALVFGVIAALHACGRPLKAGPQATPRVGAAIS